LAEAETTPLTVLAVMTAVIATARTEVAMEGM
jgi:hypothetical protein